jgi:hypothetical protein
MCDEYGKIYAIYFAALFPFLAVKEKCVQNSLNKKTDKDLSIILSSYTHTNEKGNLANSFFIFLGAQSQYILIQCLTFATKILKKT